MHSLNGRRGPVQPPDHTSILVHIAGQVGEIRADVREVKRRVAKIEDGKERPFSDYLPMLTGAVILAAAAAGKVSWQEALPSVLGLFGR